MKCRSCQSDVVERVHPVAGKTTILADLCRVCVKNALDRALHMQIQQSIFAAEFGHSPDFVKEFADWVLTQTSNVQ